MTGNLDKINPIIRHAALTAFVVFLALTMKLPIAWASDGALAAAGTELDPSETIYDQREAASNLPHYETGEPDGGAALPTITNSKYLWDPSFPEYSAASTSDETSSSKENAKGPNLRAGGVSLNATKITLYGIDEGPKQKIGGVPNGKLTSFQLVVTGGSNPYYYVTSGSSVKVSSAGLIEPNYITWYWKDGVGSSARPSDMTGVRVTTELQTGTSVVTVYTDNGTASVEVEVIDYAAEYFDGVLDQYVADHVTDGMTVREKVEVACQYPASFPYSTSASSAYGMYYNGGGDCWASTDAIIRICKKMGLNAWWRNGNKDVGAGSGHANAIIDGGNGIYYIAEAGYYETTVPRSYSIIERSTLWSYQTTEDGEGIELYQYDGDEWPDELVVPSEIDGKPVVRLGDSFAYCGTFRSIQIPSSVTSIGSFAFSGCENFEYFEIPEHIANIGDSAFVSCPNLQLAVADSNPYFAVEGNVLYDKGKTKLISAQLVSELTIPDTVTEIGTGAFYYNSSIEEVTIPASVTTIDDYAFLSTSVKRLRMLPKTPPTLGSYSLAFLNGNVQLQIPALSTGYDVEPWTNGSVRKSKMDDALIALEDTVLTYDGTMKAPTCTSVSLDGDDLVIGQDYQIAIRGDAVNAGTAKLLVMGIGEYIETGFREISFTIDPASMDGAEMAAIDGVVFTGQQLRPAIAVTLNGKRLVEDTDYKVSYANNRNAGLATATATGTGNYRGTVSRQFQILPANMADVTVDVIPDQMYIGKALTPAITAKLGDNVLIENTDYTLSYRDNEAIGTATVELTGFGNIEGMREAHFSIMPASLSAATVSGIESKAFTGKPITQPKLTVSINGTTLTPNADYSVSYRNNTNVGTATVTINGLGLLAGTSIEKTFEIVKAANPLTIKAKTAKVAYGKLAKKARTLKATKVIKFIAKGQGAMTYKLVSAKKGKKSFKKSFKINKSKGTLTLKKGLGKGTYKVKVKVKAAGNASYQASAWKAITFTVRVK